MAELIVELKKVKPVSTKVDGIEDNEEDFDNEDEWMDVEDEN